jgi:hypothetical protein
VLAAFAAYRYCRNLDAPVTQDSVGPTLVAGPLQNYFDQHNEGPAIWKWSHYFPTYERHLSKFVGQPVQVVEIGVFGGGSLAMWRDYFGDKSHIYGVDVNEACLSYAGPGIDIVIGDQADSAFWTCFIARTPRIDVVIDDGGHLPHQQITTLTCLLPHVSPGGVYICEDVAGITHPYHSYVDTLTRLLYRVYERPTRVQQHIGSVHRYPQLIVIEKPTLPVQPFRAELHGTDWPQTGS